MANADDPFGFSEGAKVALEQTHQAMDTYFDFLKRVSRHSRQAELRLETGGRNKAVETYCLPGTR